ncbi:hypothetical protein [Rhodoferax ferrireducens]|uniref:hypothetical protein n=1 Tax=Rhodoferax ferrireducens TaxID=192843 RepID=UPI000E0D247F|nr:hypothetical protein [Rhodoferax ferrireducens]
MDPQNPDVDNGRLPVSLRLAAHEGRLHDHNKSSSEFKFKVNEQENIPLFDSFGDGNREPLLGENDFEKSRTTNELLDANAVILRVDREVLVHESTLGELKYVSGAFCDLNWAALDGLARAIGSLIPTMLSINKADIMFRSGFIVGKDRLCPAAQFSLSNEVRGIIGHEQLIDTIQQCVDQLKDQRLWDYAKPSLEGEVEKKAWALVEAARKARQEIPGKQLPFTCSVVSAESRKTLKIGPDLARAKAKTTEEKDDGGVGILTGYCTHERIIKFKAKGTNSSIAIGFDEEKFLNDIYNFSGKNSHTVCVKWLNVFVDRVLSHRILVELNSLVAPLL